MKELARLAIFAGALIGIGGLIYLNLGGLAGAALFAFGLAAVIICRAQLFTGKAGYLPYRDWPRLIAIIAFNAVGCLLLATLTLYSTNEQLFTNLDKIILARQTASWHAILVTAIGTGAIMTIAVFGALRKNFIPLLLGVPVFILCGLPHCVADAFYYAAKGLNDGFGWWMLGAWWPAIIGNYIGCNLPRILMGKANFERIE